MKIFITGHKGFLGSEFIKRYGQNYEIVGYDREDGDYEGKFWYEPFSIVDELPHIDISKAKKILGYDPEKPNHTDEQIHSTLEERVK